MQSRVQQQQQQKHCITSGSHVIPQRSTDEAKPNLTSVIGREPVCCGWYERSMQPVHNEICMLKELRSDLALHVMWP